MVLIIFVFFFFKQKTAYEMLISDWSSDVCSSDLTPQWIIGPNTIHYWWVGEWKRAFPNACVFLAPGIPKRAKRRVDYPFVTLDHGTAWPWCHQLKTWVIRGNGITEEIGRASGRERVVQYG